MAASHRKLGILGGSFDPVHLGHLRSAEEVREAFALDRILFVPAATPPHKTNHAVTAESLRLEMLRLAIAGNPFFEASPLELERGGVSYSVDTLRALRSQESDAELFFIVGEDTFRDIHSWKETERLFQLANLVVVSRPPGTKATPAIEHLPVAARNAFCYEETTEAYRHQSGTILTFLSITGLDIASSRIRDSVQRGRSIRYLVPPAVEWFIRERDLYGGGDPAA